MTVASPAAFAASKSYNELAVDFPLDGGAMLMYSHMWYLTKYIHAGIVAGGGEIQNSFTLSTPTGDLDSRTKALVLPYIGPRIGVYFPYIGISVGYGAFFAQTDLEVKRPGDSSLTGSKSGLGTGFYSPLLVLDFFDNAHNIIFGFGLGGFLGSSYPTLEASSGASRLTTNANPLDALTVHLQMSWSAASHLKPHNESDDL